MNEPTLLLLDTNGVYIPQLFCDNTDEVCAKEANISFEDVQICQAGPDHEWYWEAWDSILNDFKYTDTQGVVWRLHQDGDLWEVPDGYEWPEQ